MCGKLLWLVFYNKGETYSVEYEDTYLFTQIYIHSLYPDSFCISYVAHRWGFESLRETRAGRMTQWEKNLLCKYEDPSSDPKIPCKKSHAAWHVPKTLS